MAFFKVNAVTAMLIAALSFSFCPLLYAISSEDIAPIVQAFYVQVWVTIVASIVIIIKTKSIKNIYQPLISLFKLPWETWSVIVLSGLGGYMGTLFFLWSINLMSDAGAAIIMEAWPLLAVLIAPVLIKDHAQKIKLLDVLLMIILFIGLLMICAGDSGLTFEQFVTNPLFMFSNKSLEEFSGILLAFLSAFCYAWAGVSRPYFLSLLTNNFRKKYLIDHGRWYESLFAFWLTCLTAIPLGLFFAVYFENDVFIPPYNSLISLGLGVFLTTMGCFYAYSLMLSKSSTINLLWYISPIVAAVWLVIFGYSEITSLLIAGGCLIIFANLVLILTTKDNSITKIEEA